MLLYTTDKGSLDYSLREGNKNQSCYGLIPLLLVTDRSGAEAIVLYVMMVKIKVRLK